MAVREGRHAAVVDPGDAAPVLAYLEREGLALIGDRHHAPPWRSRRRQRGAARALSCPGVRPRARDDPRAHACARGGRRDHRAGIGLGAPGAGHPGPHGRTHRVRRKRRGRRELRSSATRCSPAAAGGCSRDAAQMRRRACASRSTSAPSAPAIAWHWTASYCAPERAALRVTLANLRFALRLSLGHPQPRQRRRRAVLPRDPGRVPVAVEPCRRERSERTPFRRGAGRPLFALWRTSPGARDGRPVRALQSHGPGRMRRLHYAAVRTTTDFT